MAFSRDEPLAAASCIIVNVFLSNDHQPSADAAFPRSPASGGSQRCDEAPCRSVWTLCTTDLSPGGVEERSASVAVVRPAYTHTAR